MNPYKVGILKDIAKGLLVSNGGSGLSAITPSLPTFSQISGLFSRKKYDDYDYEEDDDDSYEEVYEYDTKRLENLAEGILKTLIDIDQFRENNHQYKKALGEYQTIVAARRHKEILGVFAEGMKGRLQYSARPLQIPNKEKSNLPLLLGGVAIGAIAFLLPGEAYARKLEEEFGFDELKKEVEDFEKEVDNAEKDVSSLEKDAEEVLNTPFETELDAAEKDFNTDELEKMISDSEEDIKKLEDETSKIKLEPPQEQKPPELTQATDQLQQVTQQVQQLQQEIGKEETPVPAPVTPAPVTPAPVTPAPVTPAPVTPAPVVQPAPVTPPPVTPAPVTPAPVTPAPVVQPAPVTPAPVTPAPVTPAPVVQPAPVTPAPVAQTVQPRVTPSPGPRVRPDEAAILAPVTPTTQAATAVPTAPVAPVTTATATSARNLSVEDIKQMIGKTEGGKLGYNAANVPVFKERSKYKESEIKEINKQLFKEAEIVKGNIDATTGRKFDKNMSEMTIEEVIDLGNRRRAHYANFKFKGKPVELAITTASGKYGFIAAALEDNGYRLFGKDWKKETYSSETQEALQTFLLKTNILRAEDEKAPVSTAYLYMKHFFGPNSSKPLQIINAKDDEKMNDIMSDAQKNSNPAQANMTVKQYKEHLIKKGFSFEVIDTKKLISEEDRRKIKPARAAPQVNRAAGQRVSDASVFNKDQRMAAVSQPFVYVQNNNTTVINRVGTGQNAPRQINNNPGLA